MDTFVNPYTFVPFPELREPDDFRRPPAGHHRLGGDAAVPRYAGRITVELTARSPLLLRNVIRDARTTGKDARGTYDAFPRRTLPDGPKDTKAVPYLPGSSLAGAIRSLHESLAGGCLRVHDQNFLPVYRQLPKGLDGSWHLALVGNVAEDGRPSRLQLCTEEVWVEANALGTGLGGVAHVVTGTRFDLDRGDFHGSSRTTATHGVHRTAGRPGEWVLLVTDTAARNDKQPCYFAAGRLGQEPKHLIGDGTRTSVIDDEVWEGFRQRVDGTDDMRRARARGMVVPATLDELREKVSFRKRPVGYRHAVRDRLLPGQVLWVRTEKHGDTLRVTDLTLAQIWRGFGGEVRAIDRTPELLDPCPPRGGQLLLCPTCRVLGAADTAGAEDGREAVQRSYRGHVRFSDAFPLPQTPMNLRVHDLSPLAAPKPGAGQFYLDPVSWPDRSLPRQGEQKPLREWGSAADGNGARRLRGRKQYWLTGRHTDRPYFRLGDGKGKDAKDNPFARNRQGEENKMAGRAEAVEAGARFSFTVRYENLAAAELGGLLAVLAPAELLSGLVPHADGVAEIGLAVGGGRPLGFGTCTSRVTALEVHTANTRYLGEEAPQDLPTVESALAAFRGSVDAGVRETWPALAAALHLDHVDPVEVWYPPKADIPEGELQASDLDAGFKNFWQRSQGWQNSSVASPMVALPHVTDKDHGLPVHPPTRPLPPAAGSRGGRR